MDFARLAQCEDKLRTTLGDKASIARSQNYYLDITHIQANKGSAVLALSELLNIPTQRIATIGDMSNDIRMFESAAFLPLGRHHKIATRLLGGRMGARLIIVSNRVAVPDSPGTPFAGGMAVAAKAALKNRKGMWVGWSGKAADEPADASQAVELDKVAYVLIDLSKNDIQEYYNGLANSVLWPILHYRVDLQEYSRADASGYMRVNRMFADRLSALVGFVTLPCGEREASAAQELSGCGDCGPPCGHRRSAKRAVRLGRSEMALDVESVVEGGVCGKKFLG